MRSRLSLLVFLPALLLLAPAQARAAEPPPGPPLVLAVALPALQHASLEQLSAPTLAVDWAAPLVALMPFIGPYLGDVAVALIITLGGGLGGLLMHLRASKARHAALALAAATQRGFLYVEAKVAPVLRGPDGKLPPNAQGLARQAAIASGLDWLRTQAAGDLRKAYGKTDEQLAAELGEKVDALATAMPSGPAPVLPASPDAQATAAEINAKLAGA